MFNYKRRQKFFSFEGRKPLFCDSEGKILLFSKKNHKRDFYLFIDIFLSIFTFHLLFFINFLYFLRLVMVVMAMFFMFKTTPSRILSKQKTRFLFLFFLFLLFSQIHKKHTTPTNNSTPPPPPPPTKTTTTTNRTLVEHGPMLFAEMSQKHIDILRLHLLELVGMENILFVVLIILIICYFV